MRILNYKSFLEEANIDLGELAKIRNGEVRGNTLVSKLKGGEPLTTNNNKSIEIDKMKDDGNWVEPEDAIDNLTDQDDLYDVDKAKNYFLKNRRYQNVFKDAGGDEFKLTDFKKTKEFGSSGAGRLTRQFESVQCIFIAIKQAFPTSDLNSNNLLNSFRKYKDILDSSNSTSLCFLPEKITLDENLINDFLQDKDWVATFCRIPNKLWSRTGRYVDRNQLYSIYHVGYNKSDSPFVVLYNKYKELSIAGGFKDINIAKWCPADVYLISKIQQDEILDRIRNTDSIINLNLLVDELFDAKILIPLSLKKISESPSPFTIITNREVEKELPDFSIRSFIIGSDMKGMGSKISTSSVWKHKNDKDVDIKDRLINFDSSNSAKKQDVDGEVEGSSSRHGKISFSSIKRIIGSSNIQSSLELKKLDIEELKAMVIDLTNVIKSKKSQVNLIIRDIKGSDISSNEGKLISRIQSLQIVLSIIEVYTSSKDDANIIITKIMRYALSIQTDKFNTPRYLRVI